MRRLIFCFDGSWNKLDTRIEPSNVALVAEGVPPIAPDGIQQIVYYDEGVGTVSGEIWRGGAFGKGLIANVREAYRFLIFNYHPGDDIFVFGFSRGAFTALSFVGFVRCAGILSVNDARHINEAWELYRRYAQRGDTDPEDLLKFRADHCGRFCVNEADRDWRATQSGFDGADADLLRFRYVGVWDTVGSLGWRVVASLFDHSTDKRYRFHDTELNPAVEMGRHAVSIDESRLYFMPTLWRNVSSLNARRGMADDDLDAPFQQRWFPGDHGSVGGGGPERGLSNASLQWVLRGAVKQGLDVNLDGRSQLSTIRYNQRAPLSNTPLQGKWWENLLLWFKGALSKSRSGPAAPHEISHAALRRWFTPANELPEGKAYRPRPLHRLAGEIGKLHDSVVPSLGGMGRVTEYVVQPGDFLSKIARDRLGDMTRWSEIWEMNRDRIDDPDDVFPGDRLRLPPR